MNKKSNNITKWAVLSLALCSCSNVTNSDDKIVSKYKKDNIPSIENTKFAPPEYNLENTTFVEAFKKGLVSDLYEYVEKSPHITDTIVVNKDNYNKRMCAGLYKLSEDKVHLKYFIADITGCSPQEEKAVLATVKKWNTKERVKSNKAHEYHHRYINKSGAFRTALSAEDYARVCGHNEMAAYTCNLLYDRELVKRAILCGLKAEQWRAIVSPRFEAYWDAVEKGEVDLINPLFNNEKLDNYLIIKTSSDWWLKNEYDRNVHITEQKLNKYLDKNKWAVHYPRNNKNYQKVIDDCYTFLKDGKLVNLNIFYKGGLSCSLGNDDIPWNIPYQDFDNQPKIKDIIAKERAKPGSLLYVSENKVINKVKKPNKQQIQPQKIKAKTSR